MWKIVNYKKEFPRKLSSEKGFTLLFAVLISGLLLSVGLGILNIALKETLLSSVLRESQFAVYAADTGTECALYHDFTNNAFSPIRAIPIDCAGGTVVNPDTGQETTVGGNALGEASRFMITFGGDLPYCAIVEVTKYDSTTNPYPSSVPDCQLGGRCTLIVSRGYNTCDVNNPRRVERALRVIF